MGRRDFEPFIISIIGIKVEFDHDFAGVGRAQDGGTEPFAVVRLPNFHFLAYGADS